MAYPITFKVERPEKLSRLTTFLRFFMLIPQAVVFGFVSIAGYIVYFLSWWAILFTAHYPQSFFKFVTWWFRWSVRLSGYTFLLTDKYPPFNGDASVEYPVTVEIETPDKLSRLTTFFRFPIVPFPYPTLNSRGNMERSWTFTNGWPMTFPQSVALFFVGIAAGVLVFLAWWAILFTGKYPSSFFDFITWYSRWSVRVEGYTYYLTDKYPPFSGAEDT